jgi:hypothetical protein
LTQPNPSFFVSKVCQYLLAPTTTIGQWQNNFTICQRYNKGWTHFPYTPSTLLTYFPCADWQAVLVTWVRWEVLPKKIGPN